MVVDGDGGEVVLAFWQVPMLATSSMAGEELSGTQTRPALQVTGRMLPPKRHNSPREAASGERRRYVKRRI